MRKTQYWQCLAASCLVCALPLHAEETTGTWNLVIENDSFTGDDRNYTSGVLLSYLSARDGLPNWLSRVADWLPGIDGREGLRAGFQLGHSIFTPANIKESAFIADQRPYAGLLYGGIAVLSETNAGLDTWLLNFGVIGDDARGEQLQNGLHKIIGSPRARGWDNEIDDRFAASLVYEHRWRNLWQTEVSRYGVDVNPHIGFSLGNIGTYVNTGVTLRLGNDLENDFGPPRIRPSLPGSGYFSPRDQFGWYFFAGVDVRAVAYNALLEGNIRDGLDSDIDPERLVGDAQAGFVLTFDSLRLAYTYIYRSQEFEQQAEPDEFGSLSLSIKF